MLTNKALIVLFTMLICLKANADDSWVNNTWKNDFYKGLWEGCIDKTLKGSGYFEKNGNITGKELKNSQDPLLVAIKDACNCQTEFYQSNYKNEELKSILILWPSNKKYQELMNKVIEKCK